MKESFVFYRSFYKAITELETTEEQLELFNAICKFNFENIKPDFKFKHIKAMFNIMQPLIDKASTRYIASVENGKKGGAPLGNQNARKYPKNNLNQPKNNLNENDNVNVNDNYNVNESESSEEITDEITHSFSHTSTPSLSDIIAYGNSLGANSDYCERFYNHYESIGWVNANGIKIKNWKLTLNNWYKKDLESGKIKIDNRRRLG